jgi:hypothetical protein
MHFLHCSPNSAGDSLILGFALLIENQLSSDNYLAWLRDKLEPECERYECDSTVSDWMFENNVHLMDIFHVLRNPPLRTSRDYDGGCFVIQGEDLDGRLLAIVVAPPSDKNRVRVVKVWMEV